MKMPVIYGLMALSGALSLLLPIARIANCNEIIGAWSD
jgi:hypothetical protein